MKLAHTALAAVTAFTLSAMPLAQAEARDWHHGGHHGGRGWSNGAYFGLGALTTAALLSRPAYYYDDPYYYPRPHRVYYAPRPYYADPYYDPPTVVYERW